MDLCVKFVNFYSNFPHKKNNFCIFLNPPSQMVVNLACELIKDVNFLLLTQKNVKRITKCCLNKVIVK